MRKYILILPLLLSFAFASCQKDEISGESIFKETESRYTEFDDWLHRHYVEPYNIRFEYRMPDRETSFGYWVSPPNIKESIMIAKLIKFTTVDAMVEMMSNDNENEDPTLFVKKYFPKVVFMVGSFEISSSGTVHSHRRKTVCKSIYSGSISLNITKMRSVSPEQCFTSLLTFSTESMLRLRNSRM